ncbi:hypothetical protein P20652_3306 [Pseudoalteromonas sp. BSi20652]|nr:hypothetical protein P20652_3306 [Pseudoalteromonas sp. BSi20652]
MKLSIIFYQQISFHFLLKKLNYHIRYNSPYKIFTVFLQLIFAVL